MLALLINGSPAPSAFEVGVTYPLQVASTDGLTVTAVTWTLARRAEPPITGYGHPSFLPLAASAYYLHVEAVKSDGVVEESVFILVATLAGRPRSAVAILWSETQPRPRQSLSARIQVLDPTGAPPKSVAWTAYLNNVPMFSGTGPQVALGPVQPGVYRVQATVVDSTGGDTVADSCVYVGGDPFLSASVVPRQPEPTLQYLGEVYSPWIETTETYCSYLPYELTAVTAAAYLLPGTHYVQPELEGAADDEVVVRTQTGNWTLRGPPGGLTDEELPYGYQHHQPFLPAALDLKLRYAIEAWNVHGLVASAQKFRVKFKCYRKAPALYRYTPCDWSAYPGGEGQRQQRLLALVTCVDVECDADLHLNRTGTGVASFTLPDLTELRAATYETTGAPDLVFQDDRHFTAQTVACHYEAVDGGLELAVNAIYGLADGIRPSYLDFGQKAYPRAVQKVKRLYGKLLVFVSGGGFAPQTQLTVRVSTGQSPSYQDVVVDVPSAVYAPDYDRYVKAGEASIDLSDFEFDRLGLVCHFWVNTASATATAPPYLPLPVPGDDTFYSTLNAPAVMVEGACYKDPQAVSVFAGTWAANGTTIDSCAKIECGPLGYYCYTELSGSGTLFVRQPYGFPAPWVAPVYDQTRCYANPALIAEIFENGTIAPVLAYTGTTGCGVGYAYTPCEAGAALAVVYPLATVPHDYVSYGSVCYALSGSVADLRPYTTVTVSSVTAVTDCQDYACTGSNSTGPCVVYEDVATGQRVSVSFPHLELGVPRIGAVAAAGDPGYGATPPRLVRCEVSSRKSIFDLYTSEETASVQFRIEPKGYARRIELEWGHSRHSYLMQPGLPEIIVPVQQGDRVKVNFLGMRQVGVTGQAQVCYEKQVPLPRLYATAVVAQAGATALQAIGFTGRSAREAYAFYGTLPYQGAQLLMNPDSRVTVQGTETPELLLIDNWPVGESPYPHNLPYYAGQVIAGPLTFRFYADRTRAGQHGEMDVWMDQDQAFPAYLQVSPFLVLAYGTYSYRRDAQEGDVPRRSLAVAASPAGIQYPRIHVSSTGERISVMTSEDYVYRNGVAFGFTGTLDTGLSEQIERF